jgi:hypothetical protein
VERLEQFRRDVGSDVPLIANFREEMIDDRQSTVVLDLRLRMRPTQGWSRDILLILGCCTNETA